MFSQEKTRYIFLFNDFHRNSSRMQLKLIFSEHEKSGSHRFQKSMTQCFHEKKIEIESGGQGTRNQDIDSFSVPIWVPKVIAEVFYEDN